MAMADESTGGKKGLPSPVVTIVQRVGVEQWGKSSNLQVRWMSISAR